MSRMQIEIWSDIACPYCYIGKKRLENALKEFPESQNIELVWKSYELNPQLPKEALKTNYYQYLAKQLNKTGEEIRNTTKKVIELAKEVNLEFDFDNLINANTFDALRLVKLAAKYQKSTEAEESLFKAYFIDSEDISDKNILIRIGEELNMTKQEIIKVLDSDLFCIEIENDMERAKKELKLNYIPYYLVNNKHIIQGSVDTQSYLEVITKAYSEWKESGISFENRDVISGQTCSLDGVCS